MDALLDNAPCGFLVFADKGIITAANRTIAGWLGFEVAELVGRKLETLMSVAGRIFYQTHFFPLLALHGSAEEIFMTLNRKDRTLLPILVNARRQDDGANGEYHCVLMPVHQRKKFEGELLQARKSAEEALLQNVHLQAVTRELEESKIDLDQRVTRLSVMNEDLAKFSKVISHDMQEPVRKMAIFTDVMLHEAGLSDSGRIRHAAARVSAASLRMQRLIMCLEQYVSIDTDTQPAEPCNLTALLEAARAQAAGEPGAEDIRITAGNLPVISGHCDQLQLMFCHLITNAVQAKKPGVLATEIHVTADVIQQNSFRSIQGKYRYVDFVRLSFSDNGRGFAPEYSEYVFQLFKKVDQEGAGLGFGLALCRKIVAHHYGAISAKPEPGKGASFTVLLPVGATA